MKTSIGLNTAQDLIKNSRGTFFSVTFTKKDGNDRVLVGRTGVTKYVTGEGLKYAPADYGLFTIYDIQNAGYRMVNVETMKSLNIFGNKFTIQ
tara:strand:- start:2187 stop:2465 length:279 start_codon:yes stop_codon:yes gene_type:complete